MPRTRLAPRERGDDETRISLAAGSLGLADDAGPLRMNCAG
jgi:hypothetical protein